RSSAPSGVVKRRAPAAAVPAAPAPPPPPPPPGAPGAAPLDHLPTMVAGQTPPPPPGAPSYGYPQHAQQHPPHQHQHQHQHPQPAAYGYPQQSPPGYGPTPPHGPGLYTPVPAPAPEPPRRSGRSTAALVVVALIVAIAAGGTVYAVMNDDSGKKKDDARNSASSDPTKRDPTSPAPEPTGPDPTSPDPSPTAKDDEEGAVPDKFLGTWSGGLDNKHGHHTRRLTLQQGETGDTALSLTAEGPLEGGGTYRCVFQGDLESASDERLHIGPTRITVGEPMSACTPGEPSVVTVLGNGKLRRANTDGKGELTYDKTG
ncbi:serine/threonine protein kinase, partial [Streptomyces sp. G44]|nr:serine/threonine protein kinase [Streptomyces sp. G44]